MVCKKNIFSVVSSLFLAISVAGCDGSGKVNNTDAPDRAKQTSKDTTKDPSGIVEGDLKVSLKPVESSAYKYVFAIQNDKTEPVELTYTSTQTYDYSIKDPEGKVLYTYSMDKTFAQVIAKKQLEPGGALHFEVNLSEGLKYLESGTYTVEIWATVKDRSDLRTEMEVTYDKTSALDKKEL
ncbi:hypothetical protein KUV80_10410 [Fictibacillus nanhaiensis]|uniref:BsuPI-related putative proteinase inhibitor n=1 Tax=Fictibacillus nanhaiensis TaxID=742169 RepID=UPI001C945269|nr:BsuPI-related putative proteinase inhibitor [Fictibacillus nanhaiensis]MBY6037071.1 hypothetical protein [Fictibacillus nanhaiensis]